MRVSEQLYAAADLVRQGWTSGSGGWVGERKCLEGAIGTASSRRFNGEGYSSDGLHIVDYANECPAGMAVRSYLELERYVRIVHRGALYLWNDKNGRTAEEVEEVLRAAAVIEAAHEDAAARESVNA